MAAPRKAATALDALAGLRAELDGIRAEVAGLHAALEQEARRPVPPAEVERRIEATIAALRDEAERPVMIGGLLLPEGGAFAGHLARVDLPTFVVAAVTAPGVLAAWLRERAAVALAGMPEPADDATRTARMAELRARLLTLERREAELLWSAEAAGIAVDWRGDLDPIAALGLDA